ncbi:MAG TPA: hypothetical protein VFR41_08890 [Acidimicrobiia bacterium]|nr:hypothetical protein [Acidimicrobiia bacterium]
MTEPDEATNRRERWYLAAEIAAYAFAIIVVLGPALWHARTELVGAGNDSRYNAWLGWRMGRLIAHGHVLPFRVPDVTAPTGLDLRLIDGYLPYYVAGLLNVVMGPTLAHNLTYLIGATANLLSARYLGRRLTTNRLVYTIGAIAFITAPPIALNVQQGLMSLFWVFPIPLLVAEALDVARGRTVQPIRLAPLLFAAYLCSVYCLVFGSIAYGVIVVVAAIRRRDRAIPLRMLGAIGLTLLALLPFLIPRIRSDRVNEKGLHTEISDFATIFSGDGLSIVAQPTRSTVLVPRPTTIVHSLQRLLDPRNALEQTLFPGVLLLGGLVGLAFVKDLRRWPLLLAALTIWILALGPSLKIGGHVLWTHGGRAVSWMPYRVLLAIPGLGSLRVPIRAGYALTAVLVAATVIALDHFVRAHADRTAFIGAGAGVLLATNLLLPLPTTTLQVSTASTAALREIARTASRGDYVMGVPADCNTSFPAYQVYHHAAIVGCAGPPAANPWRTKLLPLVESAAFAKLRCDHAYYGWISTTANPTDPVTATDLDALRRDFGVRYLIVNHDELTFCPAVRASLPTLARYRSLGGDSHLDVIDLAGASSS